MCSLILLEESWVNEMKGFWGLTKRNMLIFFKDKQSIVFSLLTSIIVLALYLLFLKGTFVDAINSGIGEFPELTGLIPEPDIDMFANFILLTGIVGSALITVPFNCLTTVVKDRENRIDCDILATPVKRWQIILAYYISAAFSSFLLTGAIMTIGLVVLAVQGNLYISTVNVISLYGVAALGSVSATAIFMIVVLFIKSSGAGGAFFGMLSAASGFVIGAYIPISQFSEGVQTVCNVFPASHITIMLRNNAMNGLLDHIGTGAGEAAGGQFVDILKDLFTFKARLFGSELDMTRMLVYVLAVLAVSIVVQIVVYSKTYKK